VHFSFKILQRKGRKRGRREEGEAKGREEKGKGRDGKIALLLFGGWTVPYKR